MSHEDPLMYANGRNERRDAYLAHDQVSLSRWGGIDVFRSRNGPGVFREHEHAEVQVSVQIKRARSGHGLPVTGSLCIVESGRPHGGRLASRAEFLLVYLDPRELEQETYDGTNRHRIDVLGSEGTEDRWMTSALGLISEELRGGRTNAVVAEALGYSIRTRLLNTHSSLDPPLWARVKPLCPKQVRQASGLLAESLTQGTSVSAIAQELGLGTSRFAKAFRASTGFPPYAFLMLHRVRHAQELLASTRLPLVEVALASGFASQSHMTTQFRRVAGITPARYRRASTTS